MVATVYRFETCELDTARREIRRDGVRVDCEPKAYEVLAYLVERAERVVSKAELREAVWSGELLSEGVLARSIWAARRVVGDDGQAQRVIRTVQRHGYRFVAPVVGAARGEAPPAPSERATAPAAAAAPSGESGMAFVGRQTELAALDSLLHAAIGGSAQIAWVSGEAGAGKTRLVEEFARLARRRGVQVRTGRVPQANGVPPYWLWRDLFEPIFETQAREPLERALGRDAAILAGVFHRIRERFPDLPPPAPLDSADGRFRFFCAVRDFIHRIASAQPLVLVLEDVHWADPSSLLLLRFLAETREPGRWLVLVAFRTHEASPSTEIDELREAILKEPMVSTFPLEGLPEGDIARLGELTAGRALSERWTHELTQRTEGNPLMVIELVRLLHDRGALEGKPVRTTTLPKGARATIESRIDRLTNACLHVLLPGSVLGRSFDADLLSAMCEQPSQAILDALDEAARAHVIEEDPATGGFRFGHALLREVIYARLSASERIRLHCSAGRTLERRHARAARPPLAALVHHFGQSPFQADLQKAIDYAVRAAEDAMTLLAYPEAIDFFRRAIESLERIAPPDDARFAPLIHGLGLAQRGAGRHTDAIETYRRLIVQARNVSDPELFAQAAIGLEDAAYTARTAAGSSIPLLDEALRGLHPAPTALRGHVLNALVTAQNVVNDPRRHEISLQAIAVARQLDDALMLSNALVNRHVAIWGPDSLEERLALDDELIALADRVGEGEDSFGIGARIWGHERRMLDLLEVGDPDGMERAIESAAVELNERNARAGRSESLRIAEDTRLAVHMLSARMFRGTLMVMEGRFDEAERVLIEVATGAQKIQAGNVLAGIQIQFFGLRFLQGRVAEVVSVARALLVDNPGFSNTVHSGLAMSLADLGRADEALAEIDHVAAGGLSSLARDGFWVVSLTTLSEALYLLQSTRHARELYALLEPYAARNSLCAGSYCAGSVARYLGQLATLLEDCAVAAQHFEVALERNLRMRAAPFVALTQYDYALMLTRQGTGTGRARALELLDAALQTAEDLGMRALRERARSLRIAQA